MFVFGFSGPVGDDAPPTLSAVAIGVDDGALGAQLGDVRRVDLRHVHREVDVVAAGAAHVLRVVPVLEGEHGAVHRQLRQIGIACRTACPVPRRARARPAACGTPRTRPARPAGSGPADGARSKSPLQVTERSPRMLSVSSAFSWPALGMPTRMPNCCCTLGSEIVGSIRPSSSGSPVYSLKSREDGRDRHGLRRERDRRAGAHRARRRRDRLAVGRDQRGAGAVVGLARGRCRPATTCRQVVCPALMACWMSAIEASSILKADCEAAGRGASVSRRRLPPRRPRDDGADSSMS